MPVQAGIFQHLNVRDVLAIEACNSYLRNLPSLWRAREIPEKLLHGGCDESRTRLLLAARQLESTEVHCSVGSADNVKIKYCMRDGHEGHKNRFNHNVCEYCAGEHFRDVRRLFETHVWQNVCHSCADAIRSRPHLPQKTCYCVEEISPLWMCWKCRNDDWAEINAKATERLEELHHLRRRGEDIVMSRKRRTYPACQWCGGSTVHTCYWSVKTCLICEGIIVSR